MTGEGAQVGARVRLSRRSVRGIGGDSLQRKKRWILEEETRSRASVDEVARRYGIDLEAVAPKSVESLVKLPQQHHHSDLSELEVRRVDVGSELARGPCRR
jgi:hypothetical protein